MQRELVERAQLGDHDAFAALAGAAIDQLDAAARFILRDPDQAKDAVQNAFIRAWRDLPRLREPDRFDAWLRRLLVNSCHDELRRSKRRSVDAEPWRLPIAAIPDGQTALADRDLVERAFRRLDVDQRTVFVLHYYLGVPLIEVAAELGIPLGTVKSRLHRGLATLRLAMGSEQTGSILVEGIQR